MIVCDRERKSFALSRIALNESRSVDKCRDGIEWAYSLYIHLLHRTKATCPFGFGTCQVPGSSYDSQKCEPPISTAKHGRPTGKISHKYMVHKVEEKLSIDAMRKVMSDVFGGCRSHCEFTPQFLPLAHFLKKHYRFMARKKPKGDVAETRYEMAQVSSRRPQTGKL